MSWRGTRAYRVWRANVIRRDGRCQGCGTLQNRHAHHIEHATYNVDLRFEVDNGICLCQTCHSMLHNKICGGYRIKCEGKHLDRFMFIKQEWLPYAVTNLTDAKL